ncbi:MAG: methionine adenosyltransferase domain-containing protein [Planctomycetota bacterium]|nr:methionine adenosyltransferase domain-containing protein [Planctomycetota bacterium]
MKHIVDTDGWRLRGAEWVLPGHPDKLADAIADDIVQSAWRVDHRALVAVEVALFRNSVFIDGRIGSLGRTRINMQTVVNRVFNSAGYSSESWAALGNLNIMSDLIRRPFAKGESDLRPMADDQSIVTGYACSTPGTDHLPVEHALARHLAKALHEMSKSHPTQCGPDGKVFVILSESSCGRRWRLESLSVSLHHRLDWDGAEAYRAVRHAMIPALEQFALKVAGFDFEPSAKIHLNGAGCFEVGGPMGDNGLSGKKLVVDFYGPRIPIGGGAMSGKDFWKVDRAGPLIAREIALKAVQVHGCKEAMVTLGIFPGETEFTCLSVESENKSRLDPRPIALGVDLRLASKANWLEGRDLVEIARWGHW